MDKLFLPLLSAGEHLFIHLKLKHRMCFNNADCQSCQIIYINLLLNLFVLKCLEALGKEDDCLSGISFLIFDEG